MPLPCDLWSTTAVTSGFALAGVSRRVRRAGPEGTQDMLGGQKEPARHVPIAGPDHRPDGGSPRTEPAVHRVGDAHRRRTAAAHAHRSGDHRDGPERRGRGGVLLPDRPRSRSPRGLDRRRVPRRPSPARTDPPTARRTRSARRSLLLAPDLADQGRAAAHSRRGGKDLPAADPSPGPGHAVDPRREGQEGQGRDAEPALAHRAGTAFAAHDPRYRHRAGRPRAPPPLRPRQGLPPPPVTPGWPGGERGGPPVMTVAVALFPADLRV